MRRPKRVREAIHARMRAAQRYETRLEYEDLDGIVKKIQSADGTFLKKRSLARTVWNVEWKGTEFTVVYDKLRKQIVTFLPRWEAA